jgi:hypothetical protein
MGAMPTREIHTATIENVLRESRDRISFLGPADLAGQWRAAFGSAADRLPRPYWLYADDEQTQLVLGFPLKVSAAWESFCRELGQLIEAEAVYRCALALGETADKTGIVERRAAFAQRLADMIENAVLHDYERRLAELLWLALSREIAERVGAALRGVFARAARLPTRVLDEIRYTVVQRVADVANRAEAEAFGRLRRWGAVEPESTAIAIAKRLRTDLLPLAEQHLGRELRELSSYLQGQARIDPVRFHKLLAANAGQLERLRQRDPAFDRTLALLSPDATTLPADRLLFCRPVLDLLEVWPHPETPRLSSDLFRLLKDLGDLLRRFEVVDAIRGRIFPVGLRGSRPVTRIRGQFVRLSAFTRPVDFSMPGVVDSSVRRYGLLYDLVEFSQILEEVRRRGRAAEDHAMRFMVRFQQSMEEIRERHRLRFEKFLGDGAFYSARSARAVLLASAELRILYERLRRQGFPFDRGLRLAINVGAYHLLHMRGTGGAGPHFEFFGHGMVELARLTTGKTTHEVEDIADFLIASGYPVQQVLEFLEPVRQSPRYPENARERPYAAFLIENRELVNRGGVATEAFLRDLEAEWSGLPMGEAEAYGVRWLVLPCDAARLDGPWMGLRALGTARLKGLDPTPLSELVVFDQAPEGLVSLPEGTPLWHSLQRFAGEVADSEVSPVNLAEEAIDPALCIVAALEDAVSRAWYIGLYDEELDALASAFRVPLNPVDLRDGEPFEAWLFRRRGELAKLYQGLRRDGSGATVALEHLRSREGYFTCLLVTPHRSPR